MRRVIFSAILVHACGAMVLGCGSSSGSGGIAPVGTNFQITTPSLPNGTVGSIYSQTIMTGNGSGPFTWAVVAGALPSGLSLGMTDGVVSGTPTAVQSSNFTVRVTEGSGAQAERSYSINVVAQSTPTWGALVLPDGSVGTPYSFDLTTLVSGGITPYTFSVVGGALPQGLTLSSSGLISGTPAAAGTTSVSFRVESAGGGGAATNGTTLTIN